MYSCGPTVYGTPHIGNLRAYIYADLLRRTLLHAGYTVHQVINITDVGHLVSDDSDGEDKLEKGARTAQKTVWEVAQHHTEEFFNCLRQLNIRAAEHIGAENEQSHFPRATAHIAEQIDLINKLTQKGHTYETTDGIYFDTTTFPRYGQFSRQNVSDKEAGARIAVRDEKRNPADFALWKYCVGEHANHSMRWRNPNNDGEGFPGWHIECSAMSAKYLGTQFDIHTGGVDHIPIHHENEIAQSECGYGVHPMANFWMHNEFLTIEGGKMSKSLGNLYTLEDITAHQLSPLAFRLLTLGTHYRQKLNFSWDALTAAESRLDRWRRTYAALAPEDTRINEVSSQHLIDTYIQDIEAALADDLNTPLMLATIEQIYSDSSIADHHKRSALDLLDAAFLGLDLATPPIDHTIPPADLPLHLQTLCTERRAARAAKDWGKSDEIRDLFAQEGYELLDTADCQIIKKKK